MSVALAVAGLLYVIAVPAVIQLAGPEATVALQRAMMKTGFEIVTYPVIVAWMSVMLWRGVTRMSGTTCAQTSICYTEIFSSNLALWKRLPDEFPT